MMTELEKKIKEAAQHYYEDGSSSLSDEAFDILVEQLKIENPDSELFKTGWGYDVAKDTTPGQKCKHRFGTAGSLSKCRTWDQLSDSFKQGDVDLSLKLDGISVVLYYTDSKLVQALTRGDGEIGIDITQKVKSIFPSQLYELGFTGAIRGEIVMSFDSFEEFKQTHPDAKNPRNSTAGVINGKDTDSDLRFLTIVVYTIVGDIAGPETSSISCVRQRLKRMIGDSRIIPYESSVSLRADTFMYHMKNFRDTWYGKYPADGIVITADEVSKKTNDEICYTAQAFKFPAEQKICEVVEVEWNLTKTRYAMPKIQIRPVELSGTTVQYCTGYNAQYIKANNIGPGTLLKIQKRGEIIPNVDEVVKSTYAQIITHCPDCGHELIWNGMHLQCTYDKCSNAIQQDSLIWIKNIAPRDGLGDKLILKMLNSLIELKQLSDLSIESIMTSSAKLCNTTNSVKWNEFADMWKDLHSNHTSIISAILALNVPRLGQITASKLSKDVEVIKMLYEMAAHGEKKLSLPMLAKLCLSVGQADTQAIEDNLWKFKRLGYLMSRIQFKAPDIATPRGKVAITGKLSVKRAQFEQELKQAGYTPGEISKDTKFLITDDPHSSSSKNKKADQWGITKITEVDFRNRYMY